MIFGKGRRGKSPDNMPECYPLVARIVFCSVCNQNRGFSKCWRRNLLLQYCPCCGCAFANPGELYAQVLPACPECGELLEQPGFDYGFCDACGSKFEIVEGTKPGWLPNRDQRAVMARAGKARTVR